MFPKTNPSVKSILAHGVAPAAKFGETRNLLRLFAKEKDASEKDFLAAQIHVFYFAEADTAQSHIEQMRSSALETPGAEDRRAKLETATLLEARLVKIKKAVSKIPAPEPAG